jgi:hypothetical protein
MGKWINLEFLIPILDYFVSMDRRDWAWDWILPAVSSVLLYCIFLEKINPAQAKELMGIQINTIAVLLGFAMTCLTVFATSSSPNIDNLKTTDSGKKTGENRLSLYQVMLANYTFTLIISILALLYAVIVYFLFLSRQPSSHGVWVSLGILLLLHILFLNIRNMTNFYHILWMHKQ